MAEQLKFFPVLSLKEMFLRGVAAQVWSTPDVLASVLKLEVGEINTIECKGVWQGSIEDKVKDKVPKLELPELLKKDLIELVRPIGLEIKRWKDFHESFLDSEEKISLPDSVKLFWTAEGMIDWRRTAEELVRGDTLDIAHRYQLACLNCLEDDIPLLWEKLPEESKSGFLVKKEPLTFFWPCIIRGELSELDRVLEPLDGNRTSFNERAFEHAAVSGNKVATKFFFQKLTSEERKASLMRTVTSVLKHRFKRQSKFLLSFRNENLSDVLCYLLTQLPPEQQLETMQLHPVAVLVSFLDCPCQDLFSENAALLWTFVPESNYWMVIAALYQRYDKYRVYIPRLLREFIKLSPVPFRKSCLENEMGKYLLSNFICLFFYDNDSESLEVMLGSVDAADRGKLVFLPDILILFYCEIKVERWHLVEMCFQKAALSVEDKEGVKNFFEILLEIRGEEEHDKRKFKRWFEFLNGNVASIHEEGNES